jgi:hypothetical protein
MPKTGNVQQLRRKKEKKKHTPLSIFHEMAK